MRASILRCSFLALAFCASCSPAEVGIFEDGPDVELTAERPSAEFEVRLCTKERARNDAQISGAVIVDGLETAVDETRSKVRVSVDEAGIVDPGTVVGAADDEAWTGRLGLDNAGPWDDGKRGCGPARRVTFELVDGDDTDAVTVFWRVSMGVMYMRNVKGKRRGWEEGDLEIEIAPA